MDVLNLSNSKQKFNKNPLDRVQFKFPSIFASEKMVKTKVTIVHDFN